MCEETRGDVTAASSSLKVQQKSWCHSTRTASRGHFHSGNQANKPTQPWTQDSGWTVQKRMIKTWIRTYRRALKPFAWPLAWSVRVEKQVRVMMQEQTDTIPFHVHYRPKVWKQACPNVKKDNSPTKQHNTCTNIYLIYLVFPKYTSMLLGCTVTFHTWKSFIDNSSCSLHSPLCSNLQWFIQ